MRVLEAGVVGSLDYKIIVAEQADGLYDWLKENKYIYSGDEATLDFYIQKTVVLHRHEDRPEADEEEPDDGSTPAR